LWIASLLAAVAVAVASTPDHHKVAAAVVLAEFCLSLMLIWNLEPPPSPLVQVALELALPLSRSRDLVDLQAGLETTLQ
jgi:hypothetical protein